MMLLLQIDFANPSDGMLQHEEEKQNDEKRV
jgi:hypothetical protein